jgi:pectate lyase
MNKNDKVPDWVKELLRKENDFWEKTYPTFSYKEKIKHWSGTLHRQMRWQIENGLDPYAIYNKNWYKNTRKFEPLIDEIMNDIFSNYWSSEGGKWSKEEYLKRIEKL